MLPWSEQVKEDVMLGTDAHELSDFIHLLEKIHIVAGSLTLRFLNQASQHRDRSRFACTVMAQKCENLVLVHLDIDSFDGLEPT